MKINVKPKFHHFGLQAVPSAGAWYLHALKCPWTLPNDKLPQGHPEILQVATWFSGFNCSVIYWQWRSIVLWVNQGFPFWNGCWLRGGLHNWMWSDQSKHISSALQWFNDWGGHDALCKPLGRSFFFFSCEVRPIHSQSINETRLRSDFMQWHWLLTVAWVSSSTIDQ